MRILFVSISYSNFYLIDDIVRRLHQRGHDVRLILGMKKKATIPDDALQGIKQDIPDLIVEPIKRRMLLRSFTKNIREVLNYAHILNHEEIRRWDVAKWGRFFPKFLWRLVSSPNGRRKLRDPRFQKIMRAFEQKIPVDFAIRRQIKRHQPDLLIAMPLVLPDSADIEYLRAAQSLGIPVLFSMASWDNLLSKGTFHGMPDYSVVWNESLAEELSNIHGISRNSIFITGAPRFDHLLDGVDERILPREEFCRMAGLDASKEYILYVGSNYLVNAKLKKDTDESTLIFEIADAFAKDPRTKDMNILVRPHPTNFGFLEKLHTSGRTNLIAFPVNGEIPDTEEKRMRFHNSIFHSLAVTGVNTTAFVEASALDKPCITIHTPDFVETQQLPHFHHLTDAEFLETAQGANDLVRLVSEIRSGKDTRRELRHAFIRSFLRPCGKPAVNAYVELVEELGMRIKENRKA